MKRAFDMVMASFGVLLLAPVLMAISLAIKLDSRGPVFYRGFRIGRDGKLFRIFKFRTMLRDAEKLGAASTSERDPRITRCGHFLRRFKLDEFPQLINVVLGDMSLVGPRPEVQKFVDMYTKEERAILSVRPGITDWASIRFHNEGEIIEASGIRDADEAYAKLIRPEKLRLQLKYVREQSLWVDIKILVSTVTSLLMTRIGRSPVGLPEDLPIGVARPER